MSDRSGPSANSPAPPAGLLAAAHPPAAPHTGAGPPDRTAWYSSEVGIRPSVSAGGTYHGLGRPSRGDHPNGRPGCRQNARPFGVWSGRPNQ